MLPVLFCIGGFFVLYLEAVSYSVNPCISRVVKVWCRVSRHQGLRFMEIFLTMVQKYNKISEPPNFTLQSYVKPILTFRLS